MYITYIYFFHTYCSRVLILVVLYTKKGESCLFVCFLLKIKSGFKYKPHFMVNH